MISADLVFFDAGGGHRAAAEALRLVMEEEGGWQVRLVNLQELLDSVDWVRKLTGLRMQDLYNLMLKKGWTLGTPQTVRVLQFLIRLLHSRQVRLLEEFWRSSQRDLVVSLVPHFNRALAQSLRQVRPATRFVTVLTDIADYPPHFWIEPQGRLHDLWVGPGRGASAYTPYRRGPDFSNFGHDPSPPLLSARRL